MKLIDADDLKTWFGEKDIYGYDYIIGAIDDAPTIKPERKKGKWIDIGSGQECSECHEIQYGYDSFRYFCAFCGADMRGEQDE